MASARSISKRVSVSAFFASALFHGMLLLGVGGYVISQGYVPKTPFVGEVLTDGAALPEQEIMMEPSDAGPPGPPTDLPEMPAAQTPSSSLPSPSTQLMTTTVISAPVGPSFTGTVSLPGASLGAGMPSLSGGGTGGAGQGAGKGIGKMATLFGSTEASSGTLTGVFYDLKQTADQKPSGMNPKRYEEVVREFVKKDWKVGVLEDFYKLKQPIYASQFFIPILDAGAAPRAFNAEKEVKPSMWVILYSGRFQAPQGQGGQYRFVGYADDVLLIRVNGRNVLDGSRSSMGYDDARGYADLFKSEISAKDQQVADGRLAYGEWMDLAEGQSQELQILLGERPGGGFCAFLMIEQRAANYKKEGNGRPILPLFKLAEVETEFAGAIRENRAPSFEARAPLFGN